MTGMHAAYAFLLGHVLSIYMAREHSTSMSQVRCHDILVVAPYILSVLSQVERRIHSSSHSLSCRSRFYNFQYAPEKIICKSVGDKK